MTLKEVITQHVGGHPASFGCEANDGPQHQDGDVGWSQSHSDACDGVQEAGDYYTDLPAKPAERKTGGKDSFQNKRSLIEHNRVCWRYLFRHLCLVLL